MQCMWNVKKKLIPVITRKTGTISKSFRKYEGVMPGKHTNYTKTASTNVKARKFTMENNTYAL